MAYARLKNTSYHMAVHCLRDMPWLLGRTVAEPEVQSTLSELNQILPPKVFWDVGANLGYYSWILLAANDSLSVRLFEPDPTNQKLIDKTIRRNHITKAALDRRAISDSIGEITFLLDERSGAAGQFAQLYESASDASIAKSYGLSKTIQVKTTTLDTTVAEGAPPPDLMKIDVEEAEDLVLAGGTELLQTGRPVLVMESFRENALQTLSLHDYCSYHLDDHHNFICLPEPIDDPLRTVIEGLNPWRPR